MSDFLRRLAIITTHPIQYNAPLFELLTTRKEIEIKVFYTWGQSVLDKKYDPGFGKVIEWDIPLLKGYIYEFVENLAKEKGSHHFKGIDNPQLISRIKAYCPNAILVYGWSFKSHLKAMRYFKNKIPVLFRGDSTLLNENGFISIFLRRIFLRWVYSHIDFALVVGKNNYQYFRKAGLKNKQLIAAPHVVDNKRFMCESADCKAAAGQFRERLNILPDNLIVLYAGKFEEVKNPEILPEAFSLAKFNEQVHLVMVGNGNLETGLKQKYRNHSHIHFMDFQNQLMMPAIYEEADVYVLPSKSETWGLAINEAMANGKAIIVSDNCGCAVDLVENGKNGYIFESGNCKDLGEKLELIFEDPEILEQMKKNSKEKIKKFSLEHLSGTIEKVVQGL